MAESSKGVRNVFFFEKRIKLLNLTITYLTEHFRCYNAHGCLGLETKAAFCHHNKVQLKLTAIHWLSSGQLSGHLPDNQKLTMVIGNPGARSLDGIPNAFAARTSSAVGQEETGSISFRSAVGTRWLGTAASNKLTLNWDSKLGRHTKLPAIHKLKSNHGLESWLVIPQLAMAI